MITLGITGRSGCGKSTVTAVFAAHGVPLADADQLSREILLPGSPLLPLTGSCWSQVSAPPPCGMPPELGSFWNCRENWTCA